MKNFAGEFNSGGFAFMDLDEIDAVFVALKEKDCAGASGKPTGHVACINANMDLDEIDAVFVALKEKDCVGISAKSTERVACINADSVPDAGFVPPEAGAISAEGFDEFRAKQNPSASFEALNARLNPTLGLEAFRSLINADDACEASDQGLDHKPVFGGVGCSPDAGTVSAGGFCAPGTKPVFPDAVGAFNAEPVLAEAFGTPSAEPAFAEAFSAPSAEPAFSEAIKAPSAEPVLAEAFGTPSAEPMLAEVFSAPSAEPAFSEAFSAPSAEPVLAEAIKAPSAEPVLAEAFGTPSAEPVFPEAFRAPSTEPVFPEAFRAPSTEPVLAEAFGTPSAEPVFPEAFEPPSAWPVFPEAIKAPSAEPAFAEAFGAPSAEPAFAEAFEPPSAWPVFPEAFNAPNAGPGFSENSNSPLPWPVFADGFDAPSQTPVFSDSLDPSITAQNPAAAFEAPWQGSTQENVFGIAEPEGTFAGNSASSCGFTDLGSIDANFNRYIIEQKRIEADKRKVKTISYISTVIVFFLGVFTFALYRYVADLRDNVRISNMARDYMSEPAAPPEASTSPLEYDNVLNELPPIPAAQEVRDEPVIEDPAPRPILSKILGLREAFDTDDIVGYVRIEGTEIDYMVMQSDDNDFYLDRDVYGQVTAAGSVFMDYESDAASLGRNTILYAHNMRNGTMFHNLRYYQDRRFFDANRYVHLTTLHDQTVWEIFAFYMTTIDFEYIQVYFPDDDSFLGLVDEITARSVHNSGIEVGSDDLMLTLSTCSGATRDSRFVIHAKLVSIVAVEDLEMAVM